MILNVQVTVKDTNNLYGISGNLTVKKNMPTNIKFTVAAEDFATILSIKRIFSKLTETCIKN